MAIFYIDTAQILHNRGAGHSQVIPLTERYRYINQVPLRNSDDALMLKWCELTITD